MRFLHSSWVLLALLQAFASAAEAKDSTTSGIVEVDVIFPRNGTFAPSAMSPIVFAVQNPHLIGSLSPRISYALEQVNDSIPYDDRIHVMGDIDPSSINASSGDPYLEYTSTSSLHHIEATWLFSWVVSYNTCSEDPETEGITSTTSHQVRDGFYFRTMYRYLEPDLVAATDYGPCNKSLNHVWNVTGLLDSPDRADRQSSCAVILPPTPTGNPCSVKIDPASASSISAALTATACLAASPKVTCPVAKNAAPGLQLAVGGG